MDDAHFFFDGKLGRATLVCRSRRGSALLLAALVVAALHTALGATARAADPAPQASTDAKAAAPRLPVVAAQGPPTRVAGKIIRSTRGRKGPVRLLVERKGGDQITLLLGPDELCEQLGLSLRAGEEVDAEGSLLKGERPILIVSSVVSGGKTIRIREADGKLVESDEASTSGAPAQGRANATMGGGKPPEPSAAPAK